MLFIDFISELRYHLPSSKEIKVIYLEVFPLLHLRTLGAMEPKKRAWWYKYTGFHTQEHAAGVESGHLCLCVPLPLIPAHPAVISGWVQY